MVAWSDVGKVVVPDDSERCSGVDVEYFAWLYVEAVVVVCSYYCVVPYFSGLA